MDLKFITNYQPFYLLTNHKDIGTSYFFFGIWSGKIKSTLSNLCQLKLGQINSIINNNLLYNVIVTIVAFIKKIFITIPNVVGGFGN